MHLFEITTQKTRQNGVLSRKFEDVPLSKRAEEIFKLLENIKSMIKQTYKPFRARKTCKLEGFKRDIFKLFGESKERRVFQ